MNMLNTRTATTFVLTSLLLCACAGRGTVQDTSQTASSTTASSNTSNVGNGIENETLASIQSKLTRGKTSRAEVVRLFGEPGSKASVKGKETLSWNYESGMDKRVFIPIWGAIAAARGDYGITTKVLNVQFSAKGIVEDYSFKESKNAPGASDWCATHPGAC